MTTAIIILSIAVIIPVVYHLLVPLKKPNLENYFTPGQTYTSRGEGVTQTILKQVGDKVYAEIRFKPFAPRPPEHMHIGFDESGTVIKGTLSARINGQPVKFKAGERFFFKRGDYHTLFNEQQEELVIRSETENDYVPVEFAYSLSQLYPLLNKKEKPSLQMLGKIAVLDELMDSNIAGPPPIVFKVIKKVMKPYARVLGVSPYDEKSRPLRS